MSDTKTCDTQSCDACNICETFNWPDFAYDKYNLLVLVLYYLKSIARPP